MAWSRRATCAAAPWLLLGCYATHAAGGPAATDNADSDPKVQPAASGATGGKAGATGGKAGAAGGTVEPDNRPAGASGGTVDPADNEDDTAVSAFPPGWLRWCGSDADCDHGFVCVQDACTARCDREPHPACSAIHATAVCHNRHGMAPDPALVQCDYYCNANAECAPFGPDYECWWQRCRGGPIK